MANTTISPNMNLTIPVVGVDPGPQWATDIDTCLTLIDGHNHTPGYGVQIPSDGLNINADLPFNNNNAISLRAVRLQDQGTPIPATTPDLGELYNASGDLYFNDGVGNQVRITQGGSIVGTSGSISGLVAPASASYNSISKTFVWQSGVNAAANMDNASITIRTTIAGANGVTISSPNSLPSPYTLTLPSNLPSANAVLTITSSGTTSFLSPNITIYDAVVGTAGQVSGGIATHSTIGAALGAVGAFANVLILPGTFTENVAITTSVNLKGSGYATSIVGTLSLVSSAYSNIKALRFNGNFNIDSASSGNMVTECYCSNGVNTDDNGVGNYVQLIQG